jgi:redox-sensitive bicupin YhaK (pirin superfamily)
MDREFLHLEADELPVLTGHGRYRCVSSPAPRFGHSSPLRAPHPMLCMDVALRRTAPWELPADYPERALYVAAGRD